jgi:hypothetical protein
VSDVLVRTRSTETFCPLLSKMQRDPIKAEIEIRSLIHRFEEVKEVKRYVRVRFRYSIMVRVRDTVTVGVGIRVRVRVKFFLSLTLTLMLTLIKRVTVHFQNTALLSAEIVIRVGKLKARVKVKVRVKARE